MRYGNNHDVFNPIGNNDPLCISIGHEWRELFIEDHRYRFCLRCDRMERRKSNIVAGIEICTWEVNTVKPTSV